jgi:hypothetical protein
MAQRNGTKRQEQIRQPYRRQLLRERRARYCWEIIADNLSKAGWSWGCVSAIDSDGRTIWIADAYRDDEKRFYVRADEKLTALMELESTIRAQNAQTAQPRRPA